MNYLLLGKKQNLQTITKSKGSVPFTLVILAQSALFAFPVIAKEALVIGSPYEKNLQRYSIDDGSDDSSDAKEQGRFQYQISCTHRKGAHATLYEGISPLVVSKRKLATPDNLSLGVAYFVSNQTSQFIFGSFAYIDGRSDGKKYFVRSTDWECKLYDSLK